MFYDYNATLIYATCYSDLRDLDKINWELFHETPRLDGYCKFWLNQPNNPRYIRRMETRQAEFLVHERFPLELVRSIGVYSSAKAEEVEEILDDANIEIPVVVKSAWYF